MGKVRIGYYLHLPPNGVGRSVGVVRVSSLDQENLNREVEDLKLLASMEANPSDSLGSPKSKGGVLFSKGTLLVFFCLSIHSVRKQLGDLIVERYSFVGCEAIGKFWAATQILL